jgi:hypothetical protein
MNRGTGHSLIDSLTVAFWTSYDLRISAKRTKLCNATPLEIIEQLIARQAFS